jgi:DNA processing protein
METITIKRGTAAYPECVEKRMHRKPPALYVQGANVAELLSRPCVAIVGSRRMTPYGKQVTQQFAKALAEQGVVIISGLAYGVDACAHRATIDAGGTAIAVLPTPVESPAPVANLQLARTIVETGGALISTYPADADNHKGNFVARNELVAALSDIVLVTEASTDSGSRHTVKFAALMPGVQIMAVPGNINQPMSAGPNTWISTEQAKLVLNPAAVMKELQLDVKLRLPLHHSNVPEEQTLIRLLSTGISSGQDLLERSRLPVHVYNQTLTMLEITGTVRPLGGNHWALT